MLEWNAHSNVNTELALRARTQVQTGHLDGKKDALLGSFNTRNVYENILSYPDACYGVDAANCDLDAEDGEQEAGAPPGGVALLSLPLQLPSLCAVSGNAFKDNGDLRAPYDQYDAELHATRLSQIRNILVGGANPQDFVSPVVADWDNDGFDDIVMVGGRNMHRISYLETSTCSNNRGDVCSGAGLCSKAYDSQCRCVLGYSGGKCEFCDTNNYLRREETALKVCYSCPVDSSGNVCSNRGICNDGLTGDGTCTCVEHFSGDACEIGVCPPEGPEKASECALATCKKSPNSTTTNATDWPEVVGVVLNHCESCPPNTLLVNDECVQCVAGQKINSTSGTCSNCPAGKFQNSIAHTATECSSCRSGHYCLEAASEEIKCSGT